MKNTGNTAKNYKIFFYSAFLNLNYSQPIHLEPQQDTIYKIPLRLSDAQWSRLGKEEIKVQVSVEDGETLNLMQELSKIGHTLKQHSSAYQDMPTQLETGFNYQGKNNIQYYAALHGRLDINPDERVTFDVRSKTFTLGQTVNNDIYAIDYTGKRWYASAGNVMQLTDFVMDGYGVRAGHKWKQENNRIGMYALVKSRVGNNKLFGGEGELLVKNRIKLIESAIASFDENNRVYSYLAKQVATTKINEEMEASITTGVGLEQILRTIVNSDKKSQVGTSLGYSYAWNNKYVNVNSTVMYNSNSYPGIFKGQRMQIHDVRAIYNKVFVGGFYDYSLRKQNVYVDTQYFSNVFNLKTQNYGIRSGVSFSKNECEPGCGPAGAAAKRYS